MDMDKLARALEKNRYTVSRFENKEEAAVAKMPKNIPGHFGRYRCTSVKLS